MAIIKSIHYWKHYLTGKHFSMKTDQKSVSYMFDQQHPSITRMYHFVRVRNLPYSIEEVKKMHAQSAVSASQGTIAPTRAHLIKATQPFGRLNIDFKGPLPSNNKNV